MINRPRLRSIGDLFATGPPWATFVLIGISLVVYAGQLRLGSTASQANLNQFGALVPSAVLQGEVWRLLSANFVHVDTSHLAFNLLSLLFLGIFLERHLGRTRTVSLFLISGLGAMIAVVVCYSLIGNDSDLVAGSSAAIFGLIGGLIVWLSRTCQGPIAPIRKRQRLLLITLLFLQLGYDLWTPDVSFFGHLSGLILGWLVARTMLPVEGLPC